MWKTKPKRTVMAVANDWKEQYCWSQLWIKDSTFTSAYETYKALIALHEQGSNDLDKVDEIIGNKAWTHNICDVCGTYSRDDMIVFDVNGEYDQNVCSACLQKSLDKLQEK